MNQSLISRLTELLGPDAVLADPAELLAYECDGFPIARSLPAAVVFPRNTQQVSHVVKVLTERNVPVVARGSGTGLTGGCVGYGDGVIVCTSRMTQILKVDVAGRTARVEAGVRNLQLSDYVQSLSGGEKLHFAPDPSSQKASTIAGNVATCAGGLHTLKYGVTTQHVLGLTVVLADGSIHELGGEAGSCGPDAVAMFCGSEGTLGLITEVCVRLSPKPEHFRTLIGIYDHSAAACRTVSEVIASGILPAAMEMMDGRMVQVAEDAFHFGFPRDAAALLLIELDGPEVLLDEQMSRVQAICRRCGAREVQASGDPVRRAELWSARKRAFGAIGRISPGYCTQDACIRRSLLPEALEKIGEIGRRYGLVITNVFHAGDGNVHPILLFDEKDPAQVREVMRASHEILEYCISIGGAVSGEHGIGVEKLPLMQKMFGRDTMQAFTDIRLTLDRGEQMNPGKKIPSARLSVDLIGPVAPGVPGGAL